MERKGCKSDEVLLVGNVCVFLCLEGTGNVIWAGPARWGQLKWWAWTDSVARVSLVCSNTPQTIEVPNLRNQTYLEKKEKSHLEPNLHFFLGGFPARSYFSRGVRNVGVSPPDKRLHEARFLIQNVSYELTALWLGLVSGTWSHEPGEVPQTLPRKYLTGRFWGMNQGGVLEQLGLDFDW